MLPTDRRRCHTPRENGSDTSRRRGKGTPRRKVKKVHKTGGTDDKKLQTSLKKLNVQPIQGIEEVNMFKSDGNVIHFSAPKGKHAAPPVTLSFPAPLHSFLFLHKTHTSIDSTSAITPRLTLNLVTLTQCTPPCPPTPLRCTALARTRS